MEFIISNCLCTPLFGNVIQNCTYFNSHTKCMYVSIFQHCYMLCYAFVIINNVYVHVYVEICSLYNTALLINIVINSLVIVN